MTRISGFLTIERRYSFLTLWSSPMAIKRFLDLKALLLLIKVDGGLTCHNTDSGFERIYCRLMLQEPYWPPGSILDCFVPINYRVSSICWWPRNSGLRSMYAWLAWSVLITRLLIFGTTCVYVISPYDSGTRSIGCSTTKCWPPPWNLSCKTFTMLLNISTSHIESFAYIYKMSWILLGTCVFLLTGYTCFKLLRPLMAKK